MKKKIVVRELGLGDDYQATLEGHPEISGFGRTHKEAVGDLVTEHQDSVRVVVELSWEASR